MLFKDRVDLCRWGCERGSKSIERLAGVGHWHCIEAAELVGDKIVAFSQ